MNMRSCLVSLMLTWFASSALMAQQMPQDALADSIAIAEAARAFSAAYMRGDPKAMADGYTEDAVIFPDRVPAISGRAAIERYWTLPGNRKITKHLLRPSKVVVHPDVAYDYGTFEVAGETDGVAWGPSFGKYVVVWKKGSDGTWRMQLDMWNRLEMPEGR